CGVGRSADRGARIRARARDADDNFAWGCVGESGEDARVSAAAAGNDAVSGVGGDGSAEPDGWRGNHREFYGSGRREAGGAVAGWNERERGYGARGRAK